MFPIRDHNPSRRRPYVTWALIAANALIFLGYAGDLGDRAAIMSLWEEVALIPAAVVAGEDRLGLLTSMFFHAGWMHIIGNMLFLWIFGDNLEDEMGHLPFLAFYLATGLAAALVHIAGDPDSAVPTIGASGAVAGVMGGYLLLFPKAKVDILLIIVVFFRVFAVPAWVMLGVWFAFQVFSGASTGNASGVAYWAHVGGFVAGLVGIVPLWLRLGGPAFWDRTKGHPDHAPTGAPIVLAPSDIPKVPRQGPEGPSPWSGSPWRKARRSPPPRR